jgi:phage baseplate assembly protein gpV
MSTNTNDGSVLSHFREVTDSTAKSRKTYTAPKSGEQVIVKNPGSTIKITKKMGGKC